MTSAPEISREPTPPFSTNSSQTAAGIPLSGDHTRTITVRPSQCHNAIAEATSSFRDQAAAAYITAPPHFRPSGLRIPCERPYQSFAPSIPVTLHETSLCCTKRYSTLYGDTTSRNPSTLRLSRNATALEERGEVTGARGRRDTSPPCYFLVLSWQPAQTTVISSQSSWIGEDESFSSSHHQQLTGRGDETEHDDLRLRRKEHHPVSRSGGQGRASALSARKAIGRKRRGRHTRPPLRRENALGEGVGLP
jgi:hypothetical protein